VSLIYDWTISWLWCLSNVIELLHVSGQTSCYYFRRMSTVFFTPSIHHIICRIQHYSITARERSFYGDLAFNTIIKFYIIYVFLIRPQSYISVCRSFRRFQCPDRGLHITAALDAPFPDVNTLQFTYKKCQFSEYLSDYMNSILHVHSCPQFV
jgi:hypothetical protein